jgi:hypothetical protein
MSKAPKSAHTIEVERLLATVPTVQYPASNFGRPPNKWAIQKWRIAAVKAGYPLCEECSMPITRAHWKISTTICQRCRTEQAGLEDDREQGFDDNR